MFLLPGQGGGVCGLRWGPSHKHLAPTHHSTYHSTVVCVPAWPRGAEASSPPALMACQLALDKGSTLLSTLSPGAAWFLCHSHSRVTSVRCYTLSFGFIALSPFYR